jgi:membrane-anchored glycerophosphoryl diester phosphodiesterase (GDPDase)
MCAMAVTHSPPWGLSEIPDFRCQLQPSLQPGWFGIRTLEKTKQQHCQMMFKCNVTLLRSEKLYEILLSVFMYCKQTFSKVSNEKLVVYIYYTTFLRGLSEFTSCWRMVEALLWILRMSLYMDDSSAPATVFMKSWKPMWKQQHSCTAK